MTTTRCPRCGNEIPAWSGGVCPVCERTISTEKRFWKRGQKHARPFRHTKRPHATPVLIVDRQRPDTAKVLLERKSRGRRRLEAFNVLLEEAYGRRVRLSDLLIGQGIPREQVTRWRQDGLWLVRFLKRLEGKLLVLFSKALPGHDPRVLSLWYGLDGQRTRVTGAIAGELGITTVEAHLAHDLLPRTLRRNKGRRALEEAALAAARETELHDKRRD